MLRHIPSEVFTWDEDARFAFLAGMIDADGYINNSQRVPAVQIGSINKELAIQQALLAQSLGMPASIYMNHYKGEGRGDTIRYHVTFVPCSRLMEFIVCDKKRHISMMRYAKTILFPKRLIVRWQSVWS